MRTAAPFPRPPEGGGGQGAGGEPAATSCAQEQRQPRGGGGASKTPHAPAERRPPAPRQAPQSAPHRGGEARARAGTRPAAGGDPRQRHDKHARDRDQGGAGGQQTAPAHTSRGDLRTRPHTDEVLTRLRGKTTVPGAPCWRRVLAACMGRAPVRPRIGKHRAAKRKAREVSSPLAPHFHVVLRPGPPGPRVVVRHVLHRRLA